MWYPMIKNKVADSQSGAVLLEDRSFFARFCWSRGFSSVFLSKLTS